MIYEFLMRLVGIVFVSGVGFSAVSARLSPDGLTVDAQLSSMVTEEIVRAVDQRFTFCTETTVTVVVNQQSIQKRVIVRELEQRNNRYWLDNAPVARDLQSINTAMGKIHVDFPKIECRNGDSITVLITTSIKDDDHFYAATRLKAESLWNYQHPSTKLVLKMVDGLLVVQ